MPNYEMALDLNFQLSAQTHIGQASFQQTKFSFFELSINSKGNYI
jgi:hypothetical protein